MDLARRRLQERYDLEAEKFREKQKEKEQTKYQEQTLDRERQSQGESCPSQYKTSEKEEVAAATSRVVKKKAKLRDDFNPLMGSSSGPRFRSTRNSRSSGG